MREVVVSWKMELTPLSPTLPPSPPYHHTYTTPHHTSCHTIYNTRMPLLITLHISTLLYQMSYSISHQHPIPHSQQLQHTTTPHYHHHHHHRTYSLLPWYSVYILVDTAKGKQQQQQTITTVAAAAAAGFLSAFTVSRKSYFPARLLLRLTSTAY